MTLWQVEPLTKRYLRGAPAVSRIAPPRRSVAPPVATPARRAGIAPVMGALLGGYALITALSAWMLSKGNPESGPIRALAPLGLLISILAAVAALGVIVLGNRRHLVTAITTLGLSVGFAVASAGAMITALF
jgi:CHASE2 domain-containing sensor protein